MVQCIEAPATTAVDGAIQQKAERLNCNISTLDLETLNQRFDQASPQEILAWCIKNIPQGLVQTTSFSLLPITHMLYRELAHPVPVIFLDTLHLFPETLETAQKARTLYDLDLHTYQSVGADSREAFATRYGEKLWEKDIDRFYDLTKVEPLQRAFDELNVKAWITGRRRDQSENRRSLPIFERDENGRLKVNPIANWTNKDVWTYTFKHNVPYNPLHDQGYTSIGDQPLTTPTMAGEDERAGRWRGSEKTECGIHL